MFIVWRFYFILKRFENLGIVPPSSVCLPSLHTMTQVILSFTWLVPSLQMILTCINAFDPQFKSIQQIFIVHLISSRALAKCKDEERFLLPQSPQASWTDDTYTPIPNIIMTVLCIIWNISNVLSRQEEEIYEFSTEENHWDYSIK